MEARKKVGLVCPRCGSIMNYQIEVELKHDGTRIVYRYYRCPVCRYKIMDSVVTIRRVNGKIVTEARNSNGKQGAMEVYSISNKRYVHL
jgi:DNA-directed RNA polymerase subunit RPC12/RpoP